MEVLIPMSTPRRFVPALALTVTLALVGSASLQAAPISSLSTNFDDGTFGGWTVDGSKTGGFGIAADGTTIGGNYDLFGTMSVNARSGGDAAYALVSATAGDALKLSRTVDLAPGRYEVGYYLGSTSTGRPEGPTAFAGYSNAISVDGVNQVLVSSGAIPNGTTSSNFQLFKAIITVTGGPTQIGLNITGSGFGRALISIDDLYIAPAPLPDPQQVPEPTALVVLGLGVAGWAVQRRRAAAGR